MMRDDLAMLKRAYDIFDEAGRVGTRRIGKKIARLLSDPDFFTAIFKPDTKGSSKDIFKFNYYDEQTLWKIIDQNSKFFNLNIDEKLYPLITERSRFTPRYLNNILLKISDYSLYYNVKKFNEKELLHAFEIMKINEGGLTYEDIEIIKIIGKNFSNRPVSLEAVASMLNEDANNIKNVNEPFLVMSNIILRTKRGRMLSQKGLKILEKYS